MVNFHRPTNILYIEQDLYYRTIIICIILLIEYMAYMSSDYFIKTFMQVQGMTC